MSDLPNDSGEPDDSVRDEYVWLVLSPPAHQRMSDDRYDLEGLFFCWAWEAGYRDWDSAVRVLARTLRGLERVGLVERRTVRRAGQLTHHGFVLTKAGRKALTALSGDWIDQPR